MRLQTRTRTSGRPALSGFLLYQNREKVDHIFFFTCSAILWSRESRSLPWSTGDLPGLEQPWGSFMVMDVALELIMKHMPRPIVNYDCSLFTLHGLPPHQVTVRLRKRPNSRQAFRLSIFLPNGNDHPLPSAYLCISIRLCVLPYYYYSILRRPYAGAAG